MIQKQSLASVLVIFILAVLLIGLVWGTYQFAEKNVSGEGFSIQWISIHELVTSGSSPYNDAVTAQIQETVKVENSFAGGNPPKYTSPLYSGVVIFPFTLFGNKTLAHALWLAVQLIAILLILILGLKLTAWKPTWYIFLLFSLFTVFSYHIVIPWLDGGLSIWASLFLVCAFIAISYNRDELGGILLALSAIQPQMVILLLMFTLIWAVSARRKMLILWFFITLLFLSIVGLFLVPTWIIQYLRLLFQFQQNFPPGSLGVLFTKTWPGLGKQLGWLISGVTGIFLLLEWFLALKKDFRWFLWTACLTIVISQWIGIPTIPASFSGLILPLILISAMLAKHWSRQGQLVALLMTILILVWEWVLFYMDLTSSKANMQLNLLLPFPLILFIGLYWVRWWAIKPQRLLIAELRLDETH